MTAKPVFIGTYKVTSGFKLPKRPDHKGIDAVGKSDATIYAPFDGTIGASTIVTDKSQKTWEWGNYVRLDTLDGKYSIFFCHQKERLVKKGQKVKAGDKLGIMGCTGYCLPAGVAGTHTHIEVRLKGTYTSINPEDILGIPNKVGTYNSKNTHSVESVPNNRTAAPLKSGNDIVWQLMNGTPKIEITEPQRAIQALDKAKDDPEYNSLYWIIYKVVNNGKA